MTNFGGATGIICGAISWSVNAFATSILALHTATPRNNKKTIDFIVIFCVCIVLMGIVRRKVGTLLCANFVESIHTDELSEFDCCDVYSEAIRQQMKHVSHVSMLIF